MKQAFQTFRIGVTVLALLLASAQAMAQSLRIDGVILIDPAEVADVSADPGTVHIVDGWIVDPAEAADPERVIDGSGLFLVPGLAEMHAHVPPFDDAQQVDDVLRLFLAHGVTTIRGMLGEPGHLILRRQLGSGERIGPRLITSGPSLNGSTVPSPGAARRAVLAQAEAGYDFLKLHPGLMPGNFAAIDRAADALGIGYGGHVSIGVGLDRALAAGQATIDHLDGYAEALVPADHPARLREPGLFGFKLGDALDPAGIDALAARTATAGVWNVPTQSLLENLAMSDLERLGSDPAMRYVAPATRAAWIERIGAMHADTDPESLARYIDTRRQLIVALHRAGAGLLAGADAPQIFNVPGDSLHRELALYVAAGLTPGEALASATTEVARFLGQAGRGCIAPGCVADLVLLEADPRLDIAHLRRIRGVIRAGRWFDRDELDRMLDEIASRVAPAGPD
jgi:imidazolonepropionase-like amidohydrolase